MKISDIITETTSAGGIATVAQPMGKMHKRNPSVFPKKKKNEDATGKQEDEFHKKLDKLVHKVFGHSSDEKKKKKKKDAEYNKKNTAYKKRSDARTNRSTELDLKVGDRVAKGDRTSLKNPSRIAHNKRAVDKSTSRYKDGNNLPRLPEEGKSPHKKGTAKYKKHMAAMHAGMGK